MKRVFAAGAAAGFLLGAAAGTASAAGPAADPVEQDLTPVSNGLVHTANCALPWANDAAGGQLVPLDSKYTPCAKGPFQQPQDGLPQPRPQGGAPTIG
ncbi:hypothetical protein [Streptomyces sp. ODS28]|uniref:hypothetical protein n=1 Tax=Streptomyces sp. ODS28 TaxID=3136688 RepID=UPI0031E5608C